MPEKKSKRYRKALECVDVNKKYNVDEAVKTLKKMPASKKDQTIDLALTMGIDPKKSDQMIRGTVSLPHGSGKDVKVLVFAEGKAAEDAKAAGADYVGFKDIIKKIEEGFQSFDVAVATPEAMLEVRKLGKFLGPRGLMPNPKTGTVSNDTAKAVKECKSGRVEFKLDKAANLHVVCGKLSFGEKELSENIQAVISAVAKAKPATAKGKYVKKATLSATFSPAVHLDASIAN
jgi:large subunit ribosomal protein L1